MGAEASSLNNTNNIPVNTGRGRGVPMNPIEREQLAKMQQRMATQNTRGRGRGMAQVQRDIHHREHQRMMNDVSNTTNKLNSYQFSSNEMRNIVRDTGRGSEYNRMNVSTRKPIYTERIHPTMQMNNPDKIKRAQKNNDDLQRRRRVEKNAQIARGINSVEDFEASEKRLEEEFNREEAQRREKFMKARQKRRHAFKNEVSKFKNSKFDPYKILSLPKNYTMEQLKRSYKKMAMRTHPDKGGDPRVFKVITKSYMYLLQELNKRNNNNTYGDLKRNADKYMGGQSTEAPITLNDDGGNFNINKFNKLYSEHRMDTPEDRGYGDWMNETLPGEKSNKPMFSKGFNIEVFNSVFNDERDTTTSTSVVQYHKPQALVSSSGVACVELGRGKISDFSSDGTSTIVGRGGKKTLQFTDYKIAHTKTTITGVKSNRSDFNSIGDLKMDRKNISYTMTPEQAQREAELKRKNEEREKRRLRRLEEHDRLAGEHFSRVRNVITGRPASTGTLAITNNYQSF